MQEGVMMGSERKRERKSWKNLAVLVLFFFWDGCRRDIGGFVELGDIGLGCSLLLLDESSIIELLTSNQRKKPCPCHTERRTERERGERELPWVVC